MIVANNICKEFDDAGNRIRVFDNLSFTLQPGESVALMGQSGAGKSTLLHLLGGFDKPQDGSIEIAGHCITDMDDAQLSRFRRQHLGMVFQQYNLIPSLSARDNISFIRRLNGEPAEDEYTRELVRVLQLEERLNHYPAQLSGGEQQRVAIARALAHRPSLILADEPTGSLDEQTATTVMELLMQAIALKQSPLQQSTLLLVTHSTITASYADSIWHLEKGLLQC